ncbi:MAG: tetratricopeptide repeat protein [Calditrichaeota bacterium]|nr:tetratricopeptide repeat protein [Calditrichota bacterium]
MKRFILFLLLILHIALADESLFKRGNEEYQNGNYKKALDYYTQIIENGDASPSLFFNMGNCYYKLNELGHAIQYYEKARQLSPLDEDIKANLHLANKEVIDHVELPDQMYIFDLYQEFVYSFSVNELLVITLVFFIVIFASHLAQRFSIGKTHTISSISRNASIVFFLLFAVLSYYRLAGLKTKQAILITKQSEAYTAPDSENQAFLLHEGAKFTISRELNNRYEITLIDGKTGWIRIEDAGII